MISPARKRCEHPDEAWVHVHFEVGAKRFCRIDCAICSSPVYDDEPQGHEVGHVDGGWIACYGVEGQVWGETGPPL